MSATHTRKRNAQADKASASQGAPLVSGTSSLPRRRGTVKPADPADIIWQHDNIAWGVAHIQSRSHPDTWHAVDCRRGTCSCTGYAMRHTCSHLAPCRQDWPHAIAWLPRQRWAASRETVLLRCEYGEACFVEEMAA